MKTVKYDLYVETADGTDVETVEVVFPAHYEVCDRCRGEGRHVNPSVDGHGISAEEFAEDPDFEEAYFSGVYDVTCEACKGNRVVEVMNDPETFTPEQKELLAKLEKQWEDEAADRRMHEAERRMGA